MAQSILANAGVASGGRLLHAGLGIIITGLLTRFFGPAHFGTYTLLLSYGALLQLAADFGLYLTLTREIARDTARDDILSYIVSLRSVLLVIFFLIGGLGSHYVAALAPFKILFFIVATGLLFQSLSQLLMGVFQRYGVVWRATVGDIFGRFGHIIGIVLLARVFTGAVAMVSSFSVGAAAALLIHYALLPHRIRVRPAASWPIWRELLTTSWPLGAMLLLNAIYFRVDTLVLALFRDAAAVGQYGLAYRVIESGLFFPAMFGGLLLPQLSRAWHRQQIGRCQQLISEGLRLLLVVAALCLLVLLLFSSEAVLIIAGPDFLPAAPLLQILSWALAIMFLGNLFGFTLVAIDRQKSLLVLYAVLAVVNTVANFVFIPHYGAVAAAVSTVVTEAGAMLTAAWLVWRAVGFTVSLQFIARLGVSMGAVLLVVIGLRPFFNIYSLLPAAALLYGAACWRLGLISKRHITLLSLKDGAVSEKTDVAL